MKWDVSIAKHFHHARNPFELDVQFNSDANCLVLFGPSGAGKTLTMKIIAGLISPDSGYVRLGGQCLVDVSAGIDVSARKRQLGYMFQDYALFPHLTVIQNIAFGVQRGWVNPTRNIVHDAVDHWIDTFKLRALQDHYPDQLSGGQRQRVALARSLVTGPRALLLDEPFAALDRGLRESLRHELIELQSLMKIPLLLISHDEDDVRYFGEQVIDMANGRVVSERDLSA